MVVLRYDCYMLFIKYKIMEELKLSQRNDNKYKIIYMPLGVAFGAALGAAFNNVAIGIVFGILLGTIIDAVKFSHKNKK